MHDGIHIEKEGTPSITISTDVFEITAKSMAEMWGANNYQILYTEHPISELNKEQLLSRVMDILPDMEHILTE